MENGKAHRALCGYGDGDDYGRRADRIELEPKTLMDCMTRRSYLLIASSNRLSCS